MQRASRERALPGQRPFRAAKSLAAFPFGCERREEPKIDVHRLIGARAWRRFIHWDGFQVTAGDVRKERSVSGGKWRRDNILATALGSRKHPGKEANCGQFDVAFAAGDLSRKTQPRLDAKAQGRVEQCRCIDEGVAMEASEASKLGLFEPGN